MSLSHRPLLREWLLASAASLALAAVIGGMDLIHGNVPGDERWIHLPNAVHSVRCVAEGSLPLWNPYIFCGLPHLASQHAAALYPPIYFFFSIFEPFRAFTLFEWLHYTMIGLGVWAWLRRGWQLEFLPALLGGTLVMFSGFAIAHRGHTPIIWTLAWTPWILWQTERAVDLKRSAGPLLAGMVAMQIAAGYMQLAMMTMMVAAALAITLAIGQSQTLKRILYPSFAIAIGIGLMAVQLLSAREILPMTWRGIMTFESFTHHGLPFERLPGVLFPLLFGATNPSSLIPEIWSGNLEQSEMTGSMPAATWLGMLLLFGFAVARLLKLSALHKRRMVFFMVLSVFSFSLLFGSYSPLAYLLFYIPGYNLFRIQTRWFGFFDLSLAVLAAFAFNQWLIFYRLNNVNRIPSFIFFSLFFFVLLFYSTGILYVDSIQDRTLDSAYFVISFPGFVHPAVWFPIIFILLAAALLWMTSRQPERIQLFLFAMILLATCEMKLLDRHLNPKAYVVPADTIAPRNESVAWMEARKLATSDFYRALQVTGEDVRLDAETLTQSIAVLNRVDALMGNWPLIVPAYGELLGMTNYGDVKDPDFLLEHPAILSMLNTRWILVGSRYNPTNPAVPARPSFLLRFENLSRRSPGMTSPWRDIYKVQHRTANGVTIIENTDCLPRAWLVSTLRPVLKNDDIVTLLRTFPAFDPRTTAFVEMPQGRIGEYHATPKTRYTTGTVIITERKTDKMWLTVDSPDGPGFLVVSEAWYPGWWARVNGELSPILRTNAVLRGISVPQGRSEVYMRYLPEGFKRGAIISLVFSVLYLLWVLYLLLAQRLARRPLSAS